MVNVKVHLPHGGCLRSAVHFGTESEEPIDHFRADEAMSHGSASGHFAITNQGRGGVGRRGGQDQRFQHLAHHDRSLARRLHQNEQEKSVGKSRSSVIITSNGAERASYQHERLDGAVARVVCRLLGRLRHRLLLLLLLLWGARRRGIPVTGRLCINSGNAGNGRFARLWARRLAVDVRRRSS